MDSEYGAIPEAWFRVKRYLSAKALDTQSDPNHIHAYNNEKLSSKSIVLTVDDLETILDYAWMYCELN